MAEEAKAPVRRRWMRILLIMSLSVNLLFLGLLAGAAWTGPGAPRLTGPGGEFRVMERALPKEAREALMADMWRDRQAFHGKRRELGEIRREMIETLRTEPFDRAAMEALLARQREFWLEMGTKGQMLMLERIEAMTPEERATFADNLAKWRKKHGKDRRD
ncbi:MAG: periplasmic heavy metal sensor [Pseudomonadota bacterium]